MQVAAHNLGIRAHNSTFPANQLNSGAEGRLRDSEPTKGR